MRPIMGPPPSRGNADRQRFYLAVVETELARVQRSRPRSIFASSSSTRSMRVSATTPADSPSSFPATAHLKDGEASRSGFELHLRFASPLPVSELVIDEIIPGERLRTELERIIRDAGFRPVERDCLFNRTDQILATDSPRDQ